MLIVQLPASAGLGQYFQFSQVNYTDQRVNPAMVAASDHAQLNLLYRNQTTGGDFNLNSTFVSASYPFLSRRSGHRWSGLGLALLDDRSGGIYAVQEASLSYAANVYLGRNQTFSLGIKGLYQQRKMNLDDLFTGMQYIPGRGFDEQIANGEGLEQLRNNFYTLSLGMYWQQLDRNQNRMAYASISFFDFNKPQDSFLGTSSELRTTLVGAAGFRIYEDGPLSINPELLYSGNYSNHIINIGVITQYELRAVPNQLAARVDLITKYVIGRSGIVGLQLHRESFSIGFSYDFPVFFRNPGNLGAFELGIQLRRRVEPKSKRVSKKENNTNALVRTVKPSDTGKVARVPADSLSVAPGGGPDSAAVKSQTRTLKEDLRQKHDSLMTNTRVGDLRRDPVELERIVLRFAFEFNSTEIDEESAVYLRDLAEIMKDNLHLKIKLTGHTDNIGSDRFNLRLSQQRAVHVKKFLMNQGVTDHRIETDGKGFREPLNENASEQERALNRRVELKIIYSYD